MKRFIWLFGENLGDTANNNSYFFWRHIVGLHDDIDKYFVLSKTSKNAIFYNSLSPEIRKYIVWKNSVRHFKLYFEADMFFVTLSYRDVRPEVLFRKKYNFLTETPVNYLQHGIIALKLLGYNGKDYNNNMFRFVYYNHKIKNDLISINGFKEYQLHYGEFLPRYQEMIRKNDIKAGQKTKILWFVTWREYLGDNIATKILYLTIERVCADPILTRFLTENNLTLRVCFHNQFDTSKVHEIFDKISCPNVTWVYAGNINVMDEVVDCRLLITDYSSLGFDVTLLNKPVLLFTPDLEEYTKKRKFYCSIDEIMTFAITSPAKLVEEIVKNSNEINPFFRSRLPLNIDYDYIRAGKHIEKMYAYYYELQHHQISFLGYNFYGIGGTVQATRAMAEGLLEKGYLVQLISLKRNKKTQNVPYGLNMKALYNANSKGKREQLKRILFRNKKYYEFLVLDKDKSNLIPFAGYGLKKLLLNSKSETIVSTRESLHPFVYHYASGNVKNKIYYFHCAPAVFDEVFPELIKELKKTKLEKAVFVTDGNRQAFIEKYKFNPSMEYLILGNSLDSTRMIKREEIQTVEKKSVYRGIYLLRISKERKADIENLLNYGRYLKSRGGNDIVIDVFGTGDFIEGFLRTIVNEELAPYIHYCGQTSNPKVEFALHDALVDFSMAHSFGMPYIEGILNGKMVFCKKNPGSQEVLGEIPNVFFESFDELTIKILNLPSYTLEQLTSNYNIIASRYSREAISSSFIQFLNQ